MRYVFDVGPHMKNPKTQIELSHSDGHERKIGCRSHPPIFVDFHSSQAVPDGYTRENGGGSTLLLNV